MKTPVITLISMVTMTDVAEKAGVSRSTASFALNGRQDGVRIPEETRRRILQAAAELGYNPNQLARAVVTGKSRLIGLLMKTPDKDVEFKSRILSGVSEGAAEAGYNVKVLYVPSDGLESVVQNCVQWRMAGLVTVSLDPAWLDAVRSELATHQISVAIVEGGLPSSWGLHIGSDDEQGLRLALTRLVELGHRRIGFLAADAADITTKFREAKLRRVMDELGLNLLPEDVRYGDWWEVAPNERAARSLLANTSRPTAVLCAGDPIAAVLTNVARALGVRVPLDLSVIGYGNYSLSWFSDPALTTLSQPFQEMGRQVVLRMIERISRCESGQAAWTDDSFSQVLPMELVERASTGPCPSHLEP